MSTTGYAYAGFFRVYRFSLKYCDQHSNVKTEVATAKADWKWLATYNVSQAEDGIKGQALAL
ncbi:hypothetical protein [Nostoc sp. UHCC 0251]|uniref:hypothetical protein n=1 Tax=Nostoc sp. UHCC 0251 TaxID=3110240 RepID=UPI002B20B6CC|nr:hypothetical protein [Nostoc sp. UHCC 0251]MEA5622489.1 hypothetical protein [Nostoc sp. UHCC 0251]